MSDYVKDLNIVDFLGIIVPGSILVLLIAGDNAPLFLLWSSYFGADASPIVRGIFLAIAGYLVGMILHEIGDLAEKGVWCFTSLDPKAYAINAVGIDELSKAAKKAPLNTEVSPDRNCVFPSRARGILGCILAVLILASCTAGFSLAMRSSAVAVTAPQASTESVQSTSTDDPQNTTPASTDIQPSETTQPANPTDSDDPDPSETTIGGRTYFVSIGSLILLLATISTIAHKLYKNSNAEANQNLSQANTATANAPGTSADAPANSSDASADTKKPWEKLQLLCLQNPQIQTYVAKNGAPGKMSMFDSFRHVMRNLLIAVAIVNVFSIWHPIDLYREIAAYFVKAGSIPKDFGTLTFWFCFVVLFAFSRYSHFVFLRYKYSYEAFINQTAQDDKPDVTHHHIVLEMADPTQNTP